MTFGDLRDWYLGLTDRKMRRSYETMKGYVNTFCEEFGNHIVGDVRRQHLQEYQMKRKVDGRADATIDQEFTQVRVMINAAYDNDMVSEKVKRAFNVERKLKKGANARKRTLSPEEYEGLLGAKGEQRTKDILEFAVNTGMRSGEIRQLQWDHIDREKGMIRLPAELTKEKEAKVVPMNRHVKEILFRQPKTGNFVFTYRGEPYSQRNFTKTSFASRCKSAGIPYGRNTHSGLTFHDLRHTTKTWMAYAGVGKEFRDVILGHKAQDMDRHYINISEERLGEEMGRFTAWLDNQMRNVNQNVNQPAKQDR
jgi:integrase